MMLGKEGWVTQRNQIHEILWQQERSSENSSPVQVSSSTAGTSYPSRKSVDGAAADTTDLP